MPGIDMESGMLDWKLLLGNAAHDLKTPLSSFMAGVDLMSQLAEELVAKPTSDDTNDIARSMKAAIEDMKNTNIFMLMTINRCMDFAKCTTGNKLRPKYESVNFTDLVNLPLKCVKNANQESAISLEYACPEIAGMIITDKQWTQENLMCLLSNAIKYSPKEGKIKVRISMKAFEQQISIPPSPAASGNPTNFFSNDGYHSPLTPSYSPRLASQLQQVQRVVDRSSPPTTTMSSIPVVKLPQSNLMMKHRKNLMIDCELSAAAAVAAVSETSQASSVASTPHHDQASNTNRYSSGRNSLMLVSPRLLQRDIVPNDSPFFPTEPSAATVGTPQPPQLHIVFEIEDEGIGIPAEKLNSLFNPFQQTQKLAGGTGLGLYSLAKRVEALKGRYGVRNRENHAISNEAELPSSDEELSPSSSVKRAAAAVSSACPSGSVFYFTIPYRPDHSSSSSSASHSGSGKVEKVTNIAAMLKSEQLAPATKKPMKELVPESQEACFGSSINLHAIKMDEDKEEEEGKVIQNLPPIIAAPAASTAASLPPLLSRFPSKYFMSNSRNNFSSVSSHLSVSSDSKVDGDQCNSNHNHNNHNNLLSRKKRAESSNNTSSHSLSSSTQSSSKVSSSHCSSVNGGPVWDILLVEDTMSFAKVTTALLKRRGHTVTHAENGAEALKKLYASSSKAAPFDVIIMDLQMPVMDGIEAVRRIRAKEMAAAMAAEEAEAADDDLLAAADLAAADGSTSMTTSICSSSVSGCFGHHQIIVAASANCDVETIDEAMDAGFDAFVEKPLDMDYFTTIGHQLLALYSSCATTAVPATAAANPGHDAAIACLTREDDELQLSSSI